MPSISRFFKRNVDINKLKKKKDIPRLLEAVAEGNYWAAAALGDIASADNREVVIALISHITDYFEAEKDLMAKESSNALGKLRPLHEEDLNTIIRLVDFDLSDLRSDPDRFWNRFWGESNRALFCLGQVGNAQTYVPLIKRLGLITSPDATLSTFNAIVRITLRISIEELQHVLIEMRETWNTGTIRQAVANGIQWHRDGKHIPIIQAMQRISEETGSEYRDFYATQEKVFYMFRSISNS